MSIPTRTTAPDLVDVWWQHVKANLLIDRAAFMRYAREWAIEPIHVGDELAALVLTKANEIHLCKLGRQPIQRHHLRRYLRQGVMTRVPSDHHKSCDFVRRLGFVFAGVDAYGNKMYRFMGEFNAPA